MTNKNFGNPLYNEISPMQNGEIYKPGDWKNIPEITHNDDNIKGFFGEYRFLSNFGKAYVELDDVIYDSVEKAYQAAKWSYDKRIYFQTCTNEQAIKYNRQFRPDKYTPEMWDELKIDIMTFLIEQKFDPNLNPDNCQKLIATGDKYLEETNWWGDVFWGKTLDGDGENNLGKILMLIREKLITIERK